MLELLTWLCVVLDLGILIFVALEYFESKATNQVLAQVLNKQRKNRKRVSVDKIIKELTVTRIAERSGRAQDKEKDYMMQKLRSLGYM